MNPGTEGYEATLKDRRAPKCGLVQIDESLRAIYTMDWDYFKTDRFRNLLRAEKPVPSPQSDEMKKKKIQCRESCNFSTTRPAPPSLLITNPIRMYTYG